MKKWKVVFFENSRGDSPVRNFLDSLDVSTAAKVTQYISLLVDYGPFLKPPYIKKIQDQLFELRVTTKLAIRIFYSKKNQTFVLLQGFVKKSQKTPQKEIAIALDRLNQLI